MVASWAHAGIGPMLSPWRTALRMEAHGHYNEAPAGMQGANKQIETHRLAARIVD